MKLSKRFILFWTVVLVFFVFSAQSISDAHANSAPSQKFGYKQINLQPNDVAAFDRFGYSVDISSTFAVIGSPSHDVWDGTNLYTSAGAAYVYQRINGIWQLSTKLTSPHPQAYANFGISVSIDKNTVAIGAVGYDSSETIDIGAIYISSYADGTWQPLKRLESGGDEESENFGSALHLEGSILVVGASTSDQSGLIDSGAAYVFVGSKGNWFKQAMLTAGIPQINSAFGHSVYTDGTHIIVGSPHEDNSGRAYIYKKSSVGWQPNGFLSPGDGRDGDFFGSAVAIDDNRAVVGASSKDPKTDSGRVVNGGGVYVYKQVGPIWNQESVIELEEAEVFDSFGNSLDIHNRTLIVGAKGKNYFGAASSGVAYIYERSGSIWSQRDLLFPEMVKSYDYFGQAVRTNGEEFLIGAIGRDPKNLSNAGEAFIFDFDKLLPETGFAPNSATNVGKEPSTISYAQTAITLAIPRINVELPVVSVPSSAFGWDTRWLDNQVGHLETTAFPTLPGNTVLTGHVWDANNTPGPFVGLDQLQFGDEIRISAWGLTYTYEVRSSTLVNPDYLAVLEDRELDWITLLTCENFDVSSNSYLHRRAVQAVLVIVK